MKIGVKRLFQLIGIFVLIIFIGNLFWYRFGRYHDSALAREFYSLVDHSNQEILDLRNIQSTDWDELVIWTPYGDICDYGISGYEKGGPNCIHTTDDSECYLLFLKNNKLTGKVLINSRTVDFALSEINGRILKDKARFIYQSKGDWPRLALQND